MEPETLGTLPEENDLDGDTQLSDSMLHQLFRMATETRIENEILKSKIECLNKFQTESGTCCLANGEVADLEVLRHQISSLSKELNDEKQTRGAAEEALRHLHVEYSDANTKTQELHEKLAEAEQKLDLEKKEHEEKYLELDSKFQRLYKRAKGYIQEIQKEKDDLETQFHSANEATNQASTQLLALHQELELARQQAIETQKAMIGEKQELQNANKKLHDTIEELRHTSQHTNGVVEKLRQTVVGKEQLLEEMHGLMQSAEEKRLTFQAELSAKHEKQVANLEGQIADALVDMNKATKTISSLEELVVGKELMIAEKDVASSGEIARLRAALDDTKGELDHLKSEHEKEKMKWEASSQELTFKVKASENSCILNEIEAAKTKSHLELELSAHTQILNKKDAQLLAIQEEINCLKSEFSSYKVRAHSLLQRKNAELAAVNESQQIKALEEALKEAEGQAVLAYSQRDEALKDLQEALTTHNKELAERDTTLSNAKQQIRAIESKYYSSISHHQSEKEAWEIILQNLEETSRLKHEAADAEQKIRFGQDIERKLDELLFQYKKLKNENDSFHQLADKMMSEMEKKLSRTLESRSLACNDDNAIALQKHGAPNGGPFAAEQQILLLARKQAQREEELARCQRHILALQEEIEELEHDNYLHSQQEGVLKTELREMERMQKRGGVDMTYLKNVILKLLETGEVEALLPVIAMLLQFTPEEVHECRHRLHRPSGGDISSSPAAVATPPLSASASASASSSSLFSSIFSFV